MRVLGLAMAMVLLVAGCSDGELTMSEYAAELEGLVRDMNERIDTLDAETSSQPLTLDIARDYWSAKAEARRDLIAGLESIEPPEDAAEMHVSAVGVVSRLADADERVAELVADMESDDDLQGLAESQEFQANQAVDEEAIAICQAAQSELDSTSESRIIADTPWIPSELQEAVVVFFGCTQEERGIRP